MSLPRTALVLTLSALAIPCAPAQALLGVPVAPLPGTTTLTGTLGTVTGTVGGVVGTVGTITGTVGGVVDTAGGTLGGAIDTVLGSASGSGGTALPTGTLTNLIGSLLGSSAAGTTAGTGTSTAGGTIAGAGAGGATGGTAGSSDRSAPLLGFKVLSGLSKAARTGRLRVRVTSTEPAVVAFNGALRASKARRAHGRALRISRSLLRTKTTVMAFRRAGSLTAVVRLSAKARRVLRRASTARLALQTWASDVARNQARTSVRRTLRG